MSTTIALAGNPNSGKTTLFNALTGANQFVGNWPGVTVERKHGKLKGARDTQLVDLPGIYSLSPYTLEEVIARTFLFEEKPSAIVNIVDGSNLERNLYLTSQLLELGIPVVVAVNMMDVVARTGDTLDVEALASELGCAVVAISALKQTGLVELLEAAEAAAATPALPDLPERLASAQELFDDDSDELIAQRYDRIEHTLATCFKRGSASRVSTSDKIDRVVTNRVLALPIFAVVMFLVYFLSVTTVGGVVTDWANDGVFGSGWFLGAEPEEYAELAGAWEEAQLAQEAYEAAGAAAGLDPEAPNFTAAAAAAGVLASFEAYDDELGSNEVVAVDAAAYAEALALEEPNPSAYGIWIVGIPVLVENLLVSIDAADWVQGLVLDGIVGGVGAVLGFVPQMLVLFLLLALLEQCGYMARIAFILDRVFRRFGLSGKSFIPILIGTGCGVPGIMSSRTIENQNDRRMTIMTTTFIPCSAKLPVIALFAGAIFGGAWWVAPSAYFMGIAVILCSGIVLKKTRFFAGDAAPFLMELPAYHAPTPSMVLRSMWERAWSFIKRAGTIILLACIIIWFISGFGFTAEGFGAVDDSSQSLLAAFGSVLAWIFVPLGFGTWEAASASVTGLIAKENLVSTFAVLYAGDGSWYTSFQSSLTLVSAYALLAFNLLCAPCFAAIGAIRREMNNGLWTVGAVGYQCGVAWVVGLWIYQFGGLIVGEVPVNVFTFVAAASALAFLWLLLRPARKAAPVAAGNSPAAGSSPAPEAS